MARASFIIIFISLLHLITATGLYYVTPDDDQSDINNDCPIDHECHTLQYYLLNTSKDFTSNTQLHFLQGNYMGLCNKERFISPSLTLPAPTKTHTALYIFNSYSTMVHSALLKTWNIYYQWIG